jgi:hypothetical protein
MLQVEAEELVQQVVTQEIIQTVTVELVEMALVLTHLGALQLELVKT